jgi:hypothetical protein
LVLALRWRTTNKPHKAQWQKHYTFSLINTGKPFFDGKCDEEVDREKVFFGVAGVCHLYKYISCIQPSRPMSQHISLTRDSTRLHFAFFRFFEFSISMYDDGRGCFPLFYQSFANTNNKRTRQTTQHYSPYFINTDLSSVARLLLLDSRPHNKCTYQAYDIQPQ